MNVYKIIKQEARLVNLGFHCEEPSYFVTSQWRCCHPHCFVLYRLAFGAYFVVWLVWTCIKEAILEQHAIFIYFTTWVAMVTALYGVFAALATFHHHVVRTRPGRRGSSISRDVDFPMSVSTEPITLNTDAPGESLQVNVITDVSIINPWYLRVTWCLYEISLGSCLVLTLFYWPVAYDGEFTDTKFNNNALNTILFTLDVMLAKIPIRILHGLYPILFFVTYIVFNVIYCIYGKSFPSSGPYIYPFLNWHRPLLPSTAIIVMVAAVFPTVQFAWYSLYQLRLYVWKRYGQNG